MDVLEHPPTTNGPKYLASRGKRFAAYLIDILPIIVIFTWVYHAFFGFDRTLHDYLANKGDIDARARFLHDRNIIREGSFLIWVVYCILMEGTAMQGTLGKAAMEIKVVDENGERLLFSHSVRRNVSKTLSYVFLSWGFIWILFDKKRQGWHDKINRTYVVAK